jgi:esterase/lipase
MEVEKLEFDVGGLKLRGRLFKPAAPKPVAVLFIHGWTGRPNNDAAKLLAEHGYTSITFSLSGHNDSDGKLEDVTRAGSLREVIAAYDFFKTKLSPEVKVVAAGSSYGSYMATLLSAEREVSALSLRVPANYPDERFSDAQLPQAPDQSNTSLTEWRKQIIKYDQTRSLKSLHDFQGQIQIIEAEEDEIVPHETVQNYVNAISDKNQLDYHLMKGWPHSLGLDPQRNQQYQDMLLNWLNKI